MNESNKHDTDVRQNHSKSGSGPFLRFPSHKITFVVENDFKPQNKQTKRQNVNAKVTGVNKRSSGIENENALKIKAVFQILSLMRLYVIVLNEKLGQC